MALSMRFHANVCPIGMHIPTLGLMNYPQIRNLYDEIDQSQRSIDVRRPGFGATLIAQLEAAFDVNGEPMVCDWSKRPLEWQPTITWLRYQDQQGDMIIGGEQMQPADFPAAWASPAFKGAWEPGWISP